MNADFWLQRWQRHEIGFHDAEVNHFLAEHFAKLQLAKRSRVFLPLCGKTRDGAWLLAQGYRVAGAELSEIAITELFDELDTKPQVAKVGELLHYSASDIDIFVGDIFNLSTAVLGSVNAIYDRAALVALPAPMRAQYAAHLMQITQNAPQLLISYEYNQSMMDGPPFSVDEDEIRKLYGAHYQLQCLASRDVPGGMKGKVPSIEAAWLLQQAGK